MFNEIETIRCQRCLAVNRLDGQFCVRCGTPLLLINCSAAHRFEDQAADELHDEHLLERISALETHLARVSEVAEQALALVLQLTVTDRPLLSEIAAKVRRAEEDKEPEPITFRQKPVRSTRAEKKPRARGEADSKKRTTTAARRTEKPRRG